MWSPWIGSQGSPLQTIARNSKTLAARPCKETTRSLAYEFAFQNMLLKTKKEKDLLTLALSKKSAIAFGSTVAAARTKSLRSSKVFGDLSLST